MQITRFVILDVETTGLWPRKSDRIIEIGALAIEDRTIAGEFSTLIHTDRAISREAQRVHGITREMLEGKPLSADVMPEFQEFIRDSILVAHNAKFDLAFIRHEFHRQKLAFNHRHICTLEMSRERFPNLPNHKLGNVYRHLIGTNGGIFHKRMGQVSNKSTAECPRKEKTHRALADACMVAAIWLLMEGK